MVVAFLLATTVAFGCLAVAYLSDPDSGFGLSVYPSFGENQTHILKANVGKTLLNHIEEPNIDAEVKIISYNFPEKEWGEGTLFYSWMSRQIERGVKLKVLGGPKVQAKESLNKLIKKGLNLKLLTSPEKQHYVLIDSPIQLWAEKEHCGGFAHDCYYTKEPYSETWKEASTFYDSLYAQAKSYNNSN